MWEARWAPTDISCERQALAAGSPAAQRDAGGEGGAKHPQLQLWDQRVRERRAVAAGSIAALRD
eukprot:4733845-Pyramimonas_sp.AAC.1